MRKHFEDVKYIYTFVFAITVIISILAVIWPGMASQEDTQYYFFLANRHKDTHRYTGENLEIQAVPEGNQDRPPYIFKNRLLFLYYGYMVRLKNEFSPQYKISFDIYPELFFLKLYPLEGKIIAFNIDLLRSPSGIYALEHELDLSDRNRFLSRFIFKGYDGDTIDITDKKFKNSLFMPPTNKMQIEIMSKKGETELYINNQLISRGLIKDDVEEGMFHLVKPPGSQFQMDNLRITDFSTGKDVIREDFNKLINFLDVKERFFPSAISFFITMLFALTVLGYSFDLGLVYFDKMLGAELLWIKFLVPQTLFLLTVNRILSLEPGMHAAFSIIAAKIIYLAICFLKRKVLTE